MKVFSPHSNLSRALRGRRLCTSKEEWKRKHFHDDTFHHQRRVIKVCVCSCSSSPPFKWFSHLACLWYFCVPPPLADWWWRWHGKIIILLSLFLWMHKHYSRRKKHTQRWSDMSVDILLSVVKVFREIFFSFSALLQQVLTDGWRREEVGGGEQEICMWREGLPRVRCGYYNK